MFSAAISLPIGEVVAGNKYSLVRTCLLSIVDWFKTGEPSSKDWRVVPGVLLNIMYCAAVGVSGGRRCCRSRWCKERDEYLVNWRVLAWGRCWVEIDENSRSRIGMAVSGCCGCGRYLAIGELP